MCAEIATPAPVDVRRLIDERVASGRSVGIVATQIRAEEESVSAAGEAGEGQAPLSRDSVFELGSIGKALTATLLAEMVERSEVSLDEPVDELLPAGMSTPTRNGRRITLVHLATNTSGLPRLPTNMRAAEPDNPYADYTVDELYEFLETYELPREIGAEYEYSNLGFGLLGHALASRAGRGYEELVRERVLKPLAMYSTRIRPTDEMTRLFALPHDEGGHIVSRWELAALAGAGSFLASVDDVIRFARANIFPPDSLLGRAIAATHVPRHAVTSKRSIGLAWHTDRAFERDLIWINGQTGGSHGFVGFDPVSRAGVVVLSNSVSSIDDLGFHLLDTRLDLAPPNQRHEIMLPSSALDRYVGVYQLAPAGTVTISRTGDGLFADASGLGSAAIYPASESEFFVKVVPIDLSFDIDPSGAVVGLTLHHGGRRHRGVKVAAANEHIPLDRVDSI